MPLLPPSAMYAAHLNFGTLALSNSEWSEAISQSTQALSHASTVAEQVKSHALRFQALFSASSSLNYDIDLLQQARRDVLTIAALQPSEVTNEMLLTNATCLLADGDYTEAIMAAKHATQVDVFSTYSEELQSIVQAGESATSLVESRASAFRDGATAYDEGRYADAVQLLTTALESLYDDATKCLILRLRISAKWEIAEPRDEDAFRGIMEDIGALGELTAEPVQDPHLMYKAAYCLQILDQRDTALEIAQAALALVDSNDHTIVRNLEAVIKACLEIPDEDDEASEGVDTLLKRAAEAAESGDYNAAVSQLTTILTMSVDMDQAVYALKLRIYAYTQLFEKAKDDSLIQLAANDCETVASLVDGLPDIDFTVLRVEVLCHLERFDEATSLAQIAELLATADTERESARALLSDIRARLAVKLGRAAGTWGEQASPVKVSAEEQRILVTLSQMEAQEPHEILGVSSGATRSEIISAYRVLAKKYHPDKSNGDTRLFQKLDEAKRKLCDDT